MRALDSDLLCVVMYQLVVILLQVWKPLPTVMSE